MARWSKQKADLETRLPPLTTDHGSAGPDWHSINKAETPEAKVQWTVTWDTARHADAFNTSYHKSEPEAIESAKRFLRLGFVVYSIKDGSGLETMDERTIKERLAPAPLPQTAARF
jgi:hypothetical protein